MGCVGLRLAAPPSRRSTVHHLVRMYRMEVVLGLIVFGIIAAIAGGIDNDPYHKK